MQPLQRVGHTGQMRVHARVRTLGTGVDTFGLGRRRVGSAAPALGARVPAQQVRGDPVEPGTGIGLVELVAGTAGGRAQERLRRELVGHHRPGPPAEIAPDRVVVAVEQDGGFM
jgi:hypothetical protein